MSDIVTWTSWIDPSFTGTGVCSVSSEKEVRFALFSRDETKRSVYNYIQASLGIKSLVIDWLQHQLGGQHIVYMEAPFPGGLASPGLFMLQGLIQEFLLSSPSVRQVFSISPNWVSSSVKKLNDKKDSTSIRKKQCQKYLEELSGEYRFTNPEMLKHAGADVATAFIFWVESTRQKREWTRFK